MPGLIRGVARTAVIAGTATAVSNRVSRRQANRWSGQQQQQEYEQAPPPQQYAAPPPPPAGGGMDDKLDQLKQLGELKTSGVLTDAEFETQKAKILAAEPPGDLATNRALWALVNAEFTDARAQRAWDAPEVTWGLFEVPERELDVLGDVRGLDVVDLGCGTAYFSAWLARRGAYVVALDATYEQLATACRCRDESGVRFPLIEADGARVPLRGDRFDLVVSEYGASVWCDPEQWVAEAARLLRPGGRLVFLTNSVLATLCVPDDEGPAQERLLRPQHDLLRTEWPGGGVEFHPGHGAWISILRANGFEVEALHELHAPADARTHEYYDIASAAWAAQWPAEDLWAARRTGR